MSSPAVLLETDRSSAVATITLNRPRVLNALNHELSELLQDAVCRVENDSDVRAIVIRGAGGNFMAGGDIRVFAESLGKEPAARREAFQALAERIHAAIETLARMTPPVIGSGAPVVPGKLIGRSRNRRTAI